MWSVVGIRGRIPHKCPIGYNFALRIPFHLLQLLMQHMHQLITNDMIHFISSCDVLVHRSWPHLLFTVAFVHRCQVLLKLHHHAAHHFKASDLPFTLATGPSNQVLSWSSPPSHMTPCDVSYAMSSFITCVSLAIFPSHFHLHGMSCSHKCTMGLITYVSHINTY